MRCPRCQFENIPGQERCFKCNSILVAQGGSLGIHPPRMAARERPWRLLGRGWRGIFSRRGASKPKAKETQRGAAESVPIGGLVLSIVPGLGHGVAGRFREIRLWWVIWLVLFLLTLFFFATPPGWILLGLTAACHAWIALNVDVLDYLDELGARLIAIMITVAAFLAVYVLFPWLVLGIRFARVPFDVPALNIHAEDLLMFHRVDGSTDDLPSGTIVLLDVAQLRLLQRGRLRVDSRRHHGVGQVVGGATDSIALVTGKKLGFFVNGRVLDVNRIPVPNWLGSVSWQGRIPNDHYFASHEYQVRGANVDARRDVIPSVCLVPADRIHGQAVMIWWPLHRRHRLP